jgi:hypothetical protein
MSLGNHADVSNLEETTNGKNRLTSILGTKTPRLVYSLLRDFKIIGDPFRGIVKLCEKY